MKLTNAACKNAKAPDKAKKLFDGKGLYLEIIPSGKKYWRMKYRFGGKEKRYAIGVYPEIGLSEAREETDWARKQLREGNDPTFVRKVRRNQLQEAVENSFEKMANEWFETKEDQWVAKHAKNTKSRLEMHIYPYIGKKPITGITARELLEVLRRVEVNSKSDLTSLIRSIYSQIFRYAIITERAENDPAAALLGALKPAEKKHFNKMDEDDLKKFWPLLKRTAIDYRAKYGLMLIVLTFVRTMELRGAEWSEIDFKNAVWTIPTERMKMRRTHIAPLSKQALALFKQLQEISGNSQYVFPNKVNPNKHMNENTILYALHDMGYKGKATVHGFRARASTILNEQGYRPDVIERQLAHAETNKVRAAYNHAEYLPERTKMMQEWADYLVNIHLGDNKESSPND